jgi:hypothetical protein
LISSSRGRMLPTRVAAINTAPSDLDPLLMLRSHEGFCLGVPRVICLSAYRHAGKQHEQVKTAELCG